MGFTIKIRKGIRKDLHKLKETGLNDKFDELIQILKDDPYQLSPPYKKLVGVPYYSRRLNIQHRLVYSIDSDKKIVTILSVGQY